MRVLVLRGNRIKRWTPELNQLDLDRLELQGNDGMNTVDMSAEILGISDLQDLHRQCYWCGETAGYTNHRVKADSRWGLRNYYLRLAVCNNCNHVEQFLIKTRIDLT